MARELERRKNKTEETLVENFEKEHLRCTPTFEQLVVDEEDVLFQEAFTRIGEYDKVKSRPAWNPALRAWEMWYPSTQLCTELSANTTSTTTGTGEYYWRTRVMLKCFRERGSPIGGKYYDLGTDYSPRWRVTEVRQRCLMEIELSSDLVCLWDDYLDQLSLNPIPCVEIS